MIVKKLTITDVANQLEVSRVTIYSYIEKGLITPRKTPAGKKYFLQEDIDELSKKLMNGENKNDRL
jgi:excisionase family DNA binding protein